MIPRRTSPDVLVDGLDHLARWKYRTASELNAIVLKIGDPNLGTSSPASAAA